MQITGFKEIWTRPSCYDQCYMSNYINVTATYLSEDNKANDAKAGGPRVKRIPTENPVSSSHDSRLTFGSFTLLFFLSCLRAPLLLASVLYWRKTSVFTHAQVTLPTDKASFFPSLFPCKMWHGSHSIYHKLFMTVTCKFWFYCS